MAGGHLQGVSNALHFEALMALQAVHVTLAMVCSKMRLEMDATNMKQARTKESYDLSPLGVIFKEIKAL